MESLSDKLTGLVGRLDITVETFNLQDQLEQIEKNLLALEADTDNIDKPDNDDVELF
jgi:hypothetical protein